MRYLFALILPPVAVLLCGKPGQFLLNIVLTLCLWVPGVVHAVLVVNSYQADQRNEKLIRAMRNR